MRLVLMRKLCCRMETARCRCKFPLIYGVTGACRQLFVSLDRPTLLLVAAKIEYNKQINNLTDVCQKNLESRLDVIQGHTLTTIGTSYNPMTS